MLAATLSYPVAKIASVLAGESHRCIGWRHGGDRPAANDTEDGVGAVHSGTGVDQDAGTF